MTRNRAVIVSVLIAIATITLEATKVTVQVDKKFDFTTLKTWAWSPAGAGAVHVILSINSKSEPVQRQWEPVLMQAVEDQLASRGYVRTTTAPDFQLIYHMLITMGDASHDMAQFVPTNAQWGIPPFSPQTTALKTYPQGTLVLDAQKPGATEMFWRGMAEAKIEVQNSDAKRAERLKLVIKDLVAKFPKKPKKTA